MIARVKNASLARLRDAMAAFKNYKHEVSGIINAGAVADGSALVLPVAEEKEDADEDAEVAMALEDDRNAFAQR